MHAAGPRSIKQISAAQQNDDELIEVRVRSLNARFRDGRPSNDLAKVGIIFKQFDGFEVQHRPWQACVGPQCRSLWQLQGAAIPGRTSAMIAYQSLRDRADRQAIPLPFPDRAGIGECWRAV
jgi:hypothetical protein